MPTIDNAILFDLFRARKNNAQMKFESAIEHSEEDVYLSLHNQFGAISHRVDRVIASINRDNDIIAWARSNGIEGPVPRQGVPMKGEI